MRKSSTLLGLLAVAVLLGIGVFAYAHSTGQSINSLLSGQNLQSNSSSVDVNGSPATPANNQTSPPITNTPINQPVPPTPAPSSLLNGNWGGLHVSMIVTAKSITANFDCSHGTIDQPVQTDSKGHFSALGTYTIEKGGPVSQGNEPAAQGATYSGTVSGKSLTFTITLTSNNQQLGPYSLTYGSTGKVTKCL